MEFGYEQVGYEQFGSIELAHVGASVGVAPLVLASTESYAVQGVGQAIFSSGNLGLERGYRCECVLS